MAQGKGKKKDWLRLTYLWDLLRGVIILPCDVCASSFSSRWCSSKGKDRFRVWGGYDSQTICILLWCAISLTSEIFVSKSQTKSPYHHQYPVFHRCWLICHQGGSFLPENSEIFLIHFPTHPLPLCTKSQPLPLVWVLNFCYRFDSFDFYHLRQSWFFMIHRNIATVDAHFRRTSWW